MTDAMKSICEEGLEGVHIEGLIPEEVGCVDGDWLSLDAVFLKRKAVIY
jgi:hypothetical protein